MTFQPLHRSAHRPQIRLQAALEASGQPQLSCRAVAQPTALAAGSATSPTRNSQRARPLHVLVGTRMPAHGGRLGCLLGFAELRLTGSHMCEMLPVTHVVLISSGRTEAPWGICCRTQQCVHERCCFACCCAAGTALSQALPGSQPPLTAYMVDVFQSSVSSGSAATASVAFDRFSLSRMRQLCAAHIVSQQQAAGAVSRTVRKLLTGGLFFCMDIGVLIVTKMV